MIGPGGPENASRSRSAYGQTSLCDLRGLATTKPASAVTRSRRKPPRRRCRPTSSLGKSYRPLALLLSSLFACSETLLSRLLVASQPVRDFAKHLFVAAIRNRAEGSRTRLIRHTALRTSRSRPPPRQLPVSCTRFKTLIYRKGFGAGACGGHGFNKQSFGANEQVSRTATTPLEKRSALCLAERKRPNFTLNLLCFNLPRPARISSASAWALHHRQCEIQLRSRTFTLSIPAALAARRARVR